MKKKQLISAGLALALMLAGTMPTYADALDDAENRIAELSSLKGQSEAYLEELNSQLTDLNTQMADLQQREVSAQQNLDQLEKDLEDAKDLEASQREKMALRIQYIYENSTDTGALAAILASDDFTEIVGNMTLVSDLNSADREMLSQYQDVCDQIEEKSQAAQETRNEIRDLRIQTSDKQQEVEALYAATAEDIAEYQQSLEDAESEEARLLAEIAAQQAALNAKMEARNAEIAQAEAEEIAVLASAPGETAAYVTENYDAPAPEAQQTYTSSYSGTVLTSMAGRVNGPIGQETYYNMDMSGVVQIMRGMGNNDTYWVRGDGVKMLDDYVMVAANLDTYPRGSIVESSLGQAIVCDTGDFAYAGTATLDVATAW